ncbi:MAG: aminotransferase class IV [Tepidisphaeraceae bacterium]|jgi:branched-chain amino acid aminotransferase
MPYVWLNHAFVDESQASVSVRDTGLLHAAGVFTTMRACSGQVFRIADHLRRLRASCGALSIPLACGDDLLAGAVSGLLARNELAEARLRLTVTRGAPDATGPNLTPNVLLTASPFQAYPAVYYHKGMTAIVLDQQKLNPYDFQAGHKTLSYFSRLAALRDAGARGAGEALWFDVYNQLQSGSISNVFVVKGDEVLTPPVADELADPSVAGGVAGRRSAVLPGITRRVVFELCRDNDIAVRPAVINIEALLAADEVFLTNSIMGLMPVCRIERHAVGNDRPGPVYARLAELYENELKRTLASGNG